MISGGVGIIRNEKGMISGMTMENNNYILIVKYGATKCMLCFASTAMVYTRMSNARLMIILLNKVDVKGKQLLFVHFSHG